MPDIVFIHEFLIPYRERASLRASESITYYMLKKNQATKLKYKKVAFNIIIKFSYNAHSDWLKQRALSENKARVDDGKLAFEFL